jgi:hypothetical protein
LVKNRGFLANAAIFPAGGSIFWLEGYASPIVFSPMTP